MFSWLPYFALKLFCVPCIRLLRYVFVPSPLLVGRFFLTVFECPIFSALFYPVSISFRSSFFPSLISGLFPQVVLSFLLLLPFLLSQHVPVFFLCFIIFACGRRFLICVSSRISHLGFEFLSVFLEEPRPFH